MKIMSRYIATNMLQSTCLVLAVFICILFFIFIIMEVDQIGNGEYLFQDAIIFALISSLSMCYEIFPVMCLLGSLAGLGQMAAHNELTVLRCAGVSWNHLLRIIVPVVLGIAIIAGSLGEFVIPKMLAFANQFKTLKQSSGAVLRSPQGLWVHQGNSYIHIAKLHSPRLLEGVARFEFDNAQHLERIVTAGWATRQGETWLLHRVKRTDFTESKVIADKFPQLFTTDLLNTRLLAMSVLTPQEMTLPTLLHYLHTQERNRSDAANYAVQYWQRVIKPLAAVVMVLLALPFLMGSMRTMTMSTRMVLGVMGGFGFYWADKFFATFSLAFNAPEFLAAILPTTFCFCIGLLLMRRLN